MRPKRLVPIALLGLVLTLFLPGDWSLLSLPFAVYLGWLPILWALWGHRRSPFYQGDLDS